MAPAFPHRHFTPTPAGLPGAPPALPCSRQRCCPTGSSRPAGAGRGLRGHAGAICPCFQGARQQRRGLLELAGAGRAGRLGSRLPAAVGSKGGRPAVPCCREERHGLGSSHGHLASRDTQPRSAPSSRAGSGLRTAPQPHRAPKRAAVLRLSRQFGTGICQAQAVPRLSELRVALGAPFRQLPAQTHPARDGRACRAPAPLRRGRRRRASRTRESRRAPSRRCPVPPPSDGRSAAASP